MARISVVVEAELDVELGIVRQGAAVAGVSVERYLEDEPSVWWDALASSDPDVRVYVEED